MNLGFASIGQSPYETLRRDWILASPPRNRYARGSLDRERFGLSRLTSKRANISLVRTVRQAKARLSDKGQLGIWRCADLQCNSESRSKSPSNSGSSRVCESRTAFPGRRWGNSSRHTILSLEKSTEVGNSNSLTGGRWFRESSECASSTR